MKVWVYGLSTPLKFGDVTPPRWSLFFGFNTAQKPQNREKTRFFGGSLVLEPPERLFSLRAKTTVGREWEYEEIDTLERVGFTFVLKL